MKISLPVLYLLVMATCFTYDINRSKLIDKYACITHCTAKQVTDWSCKICVSTPRLTDVVYILNNRTNVMCYIGYNPSDKEIVVSWRGTKDARNWIEDSQFNFTAYPRCKGCQIHTGFYFDYLSVHNTVVNEVTQLFKKYADAKILITGSSMGSALASISALQLQLVFRKPTELHNFGCPRVGNIEYARFLSQNIVNRIRVVHNRDVVPHLPFQSLGYHHYAYEVLFDEDMKKYQICDDTGEDPKCSNRFDPNYSIEDHITYWIKPHDDIC